LGSAAQGFFFNKLQPFGFFASYKKIKELILRRCLPVLMFDGLRTKSVATRISQNRSPLKQ
jgi:hypothetical protein